MKLATFALLVVVLGAAGCDEKNQRLPVECEPDQIRMGEACMDPVGPVTCTGLLGQGEGQCTPTLAECTGAQVYSGSGCAEVGEARDCGIGTWGPIDTTGSVVYVDGSYTGGGSDGSATSPFTSIGEALATAGTGDTVAVAAGTYDENVSVPAGVRLEGRCASMVTIAGSGEDPTVGIDSAPGAAVVGVTVEGDGTGIAIALSDDVTIEAVVVEDTIGAGIHVSSGEGAIIGDCGIRGTARASDDLPGDGLHVLEGARVDSVSGSSFEANARAGIAVEGGSATSIQDVLLSGNGTAGLLVMDPGGTITMSGSRVATNGWGGVVLSGAGSGRLLVEGCVIEGTTDVSSEASPNGDGAVTLSGGTMELRGTVVRDNARFGVIVSAATGIIGDCGISANGADPRDDTSAAGVGVLGTATSGGRGTMTIENTTVSGNTGGGLLAWMSDVTVEDSTIADNDARATGTPEGDALLCADGSTVTATRSMLDGGGTGRLGVLVDGDGSNVIIGDCGIRGTQYAGVWIQGSASGSFTGTFVAQVGFAGFGLVRGAGSGESVEITGCTVSGVEPGVGLSEGGFVIDWGDGIAVMSGSSALVTGNTIIGVDRVGVLFDGSSGEVTGNTIADGTYGIALQNLSGAGVVGGSAGQNDIADMSGRSIAEDLNLPVDSTGWTF